WKRRALEWCRVQTSSLSPLVTPLCLPTDLPGKLCWEDSMDGDQWPKMWPTFLLPATLSPFSDKSSLNAVSLRRTSLLFQEAHTIGQADCDFFSYRLYNYKATGIADPTINSTSLRQLRNICPENGNGGRAGLDKGSRNTWDTSYFENIVAGNAVLESDEELAADSLVNTFANSADS
ncbi:hypothetical protein KI387_022215, partial [Taxus chinensis]